MRKVLLILALPFILLWCAISAAFYCSAWLFMMRVDKRSAMFFILVMMMAPAAYADETIGGTLSHSQSNVIGYNGDGRAFIGTTFTPSISGTFNSGDVSAQLAAGARQFTVQVRADNAGVPDTTVIAESGFMTPVISSDGCAADSILAFTLDDIVTVSTSSVYWLVIAPTGSDGSTYSRACAGTGTGVGTTNFASANGSSGWYDYTGDPLYMSFTIVEGAPPDEPPAYGDVISTTTSSVDQTEQNLWNAMWTFIAVMFFVVWLFRSTKK